MDKSWVSLILHGFAVAPLQNSQLQGQCLSRWWYGNNYSTNLGEHSMKLTTWIANNYVQTDFKLGSECDSGLTKWDSERVVWNSSVKQTLDHLLSKKNILGICGNIGQCYGEVHQMDMPSSSRGNLKPFQQHHGLAIDKLQEPMLRSSQTWKTHSDQQHICFVWTLGPPSAQV